jgi:catechol 2,3-dioxygenase-like lactoylglutathione lyase family enzyme
MQITSIRAFIGAKNYTESRQFYRELGFEESVISQDMSYFKIAQNIGFYLQDYYAKEWIDNSMLFLEVSDTEQYWQRLKSLDLPHKYPGVRLTQVIVREWGKECFLHDPSGILWHFGQFTTT